MRYLLLLLALSVLTSRSSIAQSGGTQNLLERYYSIKVALTRDNLDSAKLGADAFARAAAGIKDDHSMVALSSKLSADAKRMQVAKGIEAFRTAFKATSNDMIALVTKYHTAGSKAYVQYCSMQKAYWLSADEEIRNPYYGKKMLFCGQSMRVIE